jgi:DNA-binding Xre family transcriptional regulator
MSISVCVASQSDADGQPVGKRSARTSTIPNLKGSIRSTPSSKEFSRPKSSKRSELLSTAEGRAKVAAARHSLSGALAAHNLAPVAALRLRAGLSQKELCERSGIPQPHLSRLENGHVPMPDVGTLRKLALALDTSIEEVMAAFHQQTSAT